MPEPFLPTVERERGEPPSAPAVHLRPDTGGAVTMLTYDVVLGAERVDHSLVPVTSEPLDDDLQRRWWRSEVRTHLAVQVITWGGGRRGAPPV